MVYYAIVDYTMVDYTMVDYMLWLIIQWFIMQWLIGVGSALGLVMFVSYNGDPQPLLPKKWQATTLILPTI